MYIAKTYLETKFKKIFKKGDVVPDEIAEHYPTKVTKSGDDELLVETPSEVKVEVQEADNEADNVNEEVNETSSEDSETSPETSSEEAI